MTKTWKIIIAVFVIIAAIIAAIIIWGGVYYWQNAKQSSSLVSVAETKDTVIRDTIYINSVYKFVLAFPLNWGTVKEETKTGPIFTTIRLTAENDAARYIQIMVVKTKDENDPSVKDYPQQFLSGDVNNTYYYSGGGDYEVDREEEVQKYAEIKQEVKSISESFNTITGTTLAPEDMTGWKTVITYPTNGSVVEGRAVTIKGTARPNSNIWAFVTTEAPGGPEADRACLSGGVHTPDQGDAKADSKGNFEFTLKEPCSKNVWIYIASEDQGLGAVLYSTKGGWKGLCQSDSDRIGFTLSGELPASCNH